MSAILVAVFNNHAAAVGVRTRFVQDGYPTDRVALTSCQELGAVELVPRQTLADKLTEYFRKILQTEGHPRDEQAVSFVQRAVLDRKAVVTVQPRGELETSRALQMLEATDPVALRAEDLQDQSLEHAASATETPMLTWFGKVLAAPGARDTTGTPELP